MNSSKLPPTTLEPMQLSSLAHPRGYAFYINSSPMISQKYVERPIGPNLPLFGHMSRFLRNPKLTKVIDAKSEELFMNLTGGLRNGSTHPVRNEVIVAQK